MKNFMYIVVVVAVTASLVLSIGVSAQGAADACREDQSRWSRLWSKYITGSCEDKNDETVEALQRPTTSPPDAQPQQSGLYVALGDSVAAGLGLPPPMQPMNNDIACGISPQAYPTYVAGSLGLSYINAACSGATAGDLITKQRVDGPNITAQLDTAYARGVPEVITITAGANDVRWVDFARKCYITECGTRFDDGAFRTLRAALRVKLEAALVSIEQRSGDRPPDVVLSGYYQPLGSECSEQSRIAEPEEVAWFSDKVDELNETIKNSTSRYEFARYAPVSFAGHEICTDDSLVQGLDDPAPFHPTSEGQRVIGESMMIQLR